MDAKELLKKVRLIELKTKGLSSQVFSGEYHSAFKGRGMAFSEVREYMPGDEIRTIDWNVTARFNHPYVKVFHEEREMTVMLVIDISGSSSFGTRSQLKRELIAEIAAVISFSAIQNNDKIGVILFAGKPELYIPPKKGKKHILRIIRELIEFKPNTKETNIGTTLDYLNNVVKKRSIVFLISDFLDNSFEDQLKITNRKHDLVALQITDQAEYNLPKVGWVQLQDLESNQLKWVNTNLPKVRKRFADQGRSHDRYMKETFRKSGVDFAKISTGESYVKPLMNLFKNR
ncbi:MAG TPA: DUF58 domain-containing protein [Flavobacteriales bacterium]|nr:DUF58 domain-containing protein [Crocinitomicaceae bacterium]HAE30488.1 DUF58 domain-containing protein [Flavobacteriales bacterium]